MSPPFISLKRINFLIPFFIILTPFVYTQDITDTTEQETATVPVFYEENEQCFTCHGPEVTASERITQEEIDYLKKHRMIIDREEFYKSNHGAFACNQCHFEDGTDIREQARKGEFICLNCHGFDPANDPYNFAAKVMEFENSVHKRNERFGFTCWKCHNPHTYRSVSGEDANLDEKIIYQNNICLRCHRKVKPDQTKSGDTGKDEQTHHFWLPDQSIHFTLVKCIDCHNQMNNGVLLTHSILPVEQAEKRCVDCHSKDSRLLATLYNYQAKQQRTNTGFFSGEMLEELKILGNQGNNYLHIISVIIFILLILGISIHIFLRVRITRSNENN